MTFTYSPELTTPKDRVRFRIGDTSSSAAIGDRLEDEEIEATVAANVISEALAQCCEALAAKYATRAKSKQAASLKIDYSDRVSNLLSLADRLRNGIESIGATEIVITGTTTAEIAETAADTSQVQAAFKRGQFDNPTAVNAVEVSA